MADIAPPASTPRRSTMSTAIPHLDVASTSLNTKLARGALFVGFMLLVVPTVMDLARQVWNTDEQGHGPIIAAVTLWLMWRSRQQVIDAPYRPAVIVGGALFLVGLLIYALGRSQQIIQGEVVGVVTGAPVAEVHAELHGTPLMGVAARYPPAATTSVLCMGVLA